MFRPVRGGRLSEAVEDQVRILVYQGRLKPGDRLPSERNLAATFRIGRSVVREALKKLEAAGLIATEKRGSFVRSLTPASLVEPLETMLLSEFDQIEKFIEVRKSLEAWSAAEAAEKATPADLRNIESALRGMREAIEAGQPFEREDIAFHLAIVEATHNSLLLHMIHTFTTMMHSILGIARLVRDATTIRKIYGEHEGIYRAIQRRDAAQARERMLRHLETVKDTIRALNPVRQRPAAPSAR